jgi:hypothetical protein
LVQQLGLLTLTSAHLKSTQIADSYSKVLQQFVQDLLQQWHWTNEHATMQQSEPVTVQYNAARDAGSDLPLYQFSDMREVLATSSIELLRNVYTTDTAFFNCHRIRIDTHVENKRCENDLQLILSLLGKRFDLILVRNLRRASLAAWITDKMKPQKGKSHSATTSTTTTTTTTTGTLSTVPSQAFCISTREFAMRFAYRLYKHDSGMFGSVGIDTRACLISVLPHELLLNIFCNLSESDLAMAASVCRTWQCVVAHYITHVRALQNRIAASKPVLDAVYLPPFIDDPQILSVIAQSVADKVGPTVLRHEAPDRVQFVGYDAWKRFCREYNGDTPDRLPIRATVCTVACTRSLAHVGQYARLWSRFKPIHSHRC